MKINVLGIPAKGLDIEDEKDIETGSGNPVKARLSARVERAGRDVFIKGEVKAGLSLVCSRCLKEFDAELSFPLEIAFCPEEEMEGGEGHELTPEELNTGFYRDEEIDLGEITKEQVLLNIPMKSLCSESCAGICSACGTDLNEKACGCDSIIGDSRFQALKKYFTDRKE